MKCFSVPSKTYNKVSISQYSMVRTRLPHKNHPLVACITNLNDDLKVSPHLFTPPSPINMTTMTRFHTQFPPAVPQSKPHESPHLLAQTELTPLPFPQYTNKDILRCTFSTIRTYNQAKLKEFCYRSINVQVSIQDITKERRLCMKSLTPNA